MIKKLISINLVLVSILPAAVHEVSIQDFTFSPATLEVQAGDSVRWTNNDNFAHTATSNTGLWDSGSLANGESFTFQFSEAGSYDYFCTIHPSMTANVNTIPVGVDENYVPAESFKLLSVYPNPFNPSTSIQFSTDQPTTVSMKIYDLSGSLVKDYGLLTLTAGQHSRVWHGENEQFRQMSSGTYIVTIRANETSFSRKLLLMR